jgi:hypothetical protein
MSKIDMEKLRTFTEDQTYPTNKERLRTSAANHGLDEEVINLINEIPDAQYSTQEDVIHAIREIESEYQTGVWRTTGPNK